jgi:hypothetical protein
MSRVIGYCRVSTAAQGESSRDLEAQAECIRANFPNAEVVIEVALGGTGSDRCWRRCWSPSARVTCWSSVAPTADAKHGPVRRHLQPRPYAASGRWSSSSRNSTCAPSHG